MSAHLELRLRTDGIHAGLIEYRDGDRWRDWLDLTAAWLDPEDPGLSLSAEERGRLGELVEWWNRGR